MWESFASFGPWAMTAALLSWLLIQTLQVRSNKNGNGNGHRDTELRIARIETMVEDDREDMKAIRQALVEQTSIMTRLLTLFEQHVREERPREWGRLAPGGGSHVDHDDPADHQRTGSPPGV